jgi:uncharacterized protein
MPFYCGKRSADICVVLGPKKPSTSSASSSLSLATKDYSDRFLGGRRTVNQRGAIRIGVIADAHGLFDPAIRRQLRGIDRILHAGDIGDQSVIELLEQIAPVTDVSGNVDEYEHSGFPGQIVVRRNGKKIAVCHVLYERGKLTQEAKSWLDRERPDICVLGHSHRSTIEQFGPTLLFNPGSADPKRFSLPREIGLLTILKKKVLPELIRLSDNVNRRNRSTGVKLPKKKGEAT